MPWKPEFWANLPQNIMQPFPHPNDATHIYLSRLAIVSGPIWPKFELVQDFMHVIVTYKYKKDRIKNDWEKVETSFSPL